MMPKNLIDVGTLNLTEEHKAKVMQVLDSNRLSYGPMTEKFEKKFSKIHNNKYGIFTNSGTSALHIALQAMKILYDWKDGDEVILPATTFVATYNVILHNNLKPVLVDINEEMNIDPDLIHNAVSNRTRAIIPVHLLGKPANMTRIMNIAKEYGLKVIEDSCETMFVKGIGKADVTCFSFYVAHLLTTGVGGMAITKQAKLAKLMRSLSFHGRDLKYINIDDDTKLNKDVIAARFKFHYPGHSFRGTEMEAALGLVELKNRKKMLAKRKRNAKILNKRLNLMPKEYMDNNAFMMFPIAYIFRDNLMNFLEKKGIRTRKVMGLLDQPYIKVEQEYPMAKALAKFGLLVGCHQDLTDDDMNYIADCVEEYDPT